MTNHRGDIIHTDLKDRGQLMGISNICMSTCQTTMDVCSDNNFGICLQSEVNVSTVHMFKPNIMSQVSYADTQFGNIKSGRRKKQVNCALLAKRWGVDPRCAHTTAHTTT